MYHSLPYLKKQAVLTTSWFPLFGNFKNKQITIPSSHNRENVTNLYSQDDLF